MTERSLHIARETFVSIAGSPIPTGTVTVLFTDIEGSTKLWEDHPDEMQATLARHDALVRKAIVGANGHIFKTVGDAFCAAFAVAADAVAAAHSAQRTIAVEPWPDATRIKVRMALHTGAVESRDGDYFGATLNRVARLLLTGHGGQTLLSQATYELVHRTLPDTVTLRDLGAHQLKDLARPEQVYELLHPGLQSDFPPIKSLSTHPNNLPRQLTTFIGREKEIAEIKALPVTTRLLTLTGSGGSGKTRLALHVAAELLRHFPDGAWLVELAPLADPNFVPQTVALVLGVKEEPDKSVTQTLTGHLEHKRILLILDNCEHLLDACSRLADAFARQCPEVKILATSREALGLAGERAYRVPSLSLPDRNGVQTPQSLSRYESVQLFIDRALLVRADFAVTHQNAPAVASVCCHLDGIPLAIELAAARVRALSVEEIDSRLDQRFRLLTGGSRTALPRQQTLRSLIDWSYDLLHDPEQRLLQRLSVFAGGWTLAAAEQVCRGDGVADGQVLDLLTSLADKSLVIAEETDGHSRYRLLETVRQYARDRLVEGGHSEAVRERHRDHFLALAEEAETKLMGAEQREWLQRLDDEHENLRAGLDWSLVETGTAGGLRLCGALQRFWWTRGHLSEGRNWCKHVLGKSGSGEPTAERAKALNAAGGLADDQADFPAARALHEESLAIWRHLGDRKGAARSLNNLGIVANQQGEQAAARSLFEECLAIMRELKDRAGIAGALNNLGIVSLHHGDLASARALHEESLQIMRELGHGEGVGDALNNLGGIAYYQGDYPRARSLLEEGLAIRRNLGHRSGIADVLGILGNVAHELGEFASARALHEEALTIRRELGDGRGIADSLAGMATVVAALGSPLRAARAWGAAERLREEVGFPLPPHERPQHDRRMAAARATSSDDAAFDRAWQEGRAVSLEQAIELALADAVARQ